MTPISRAAVHQDRMESARPAPAARTVAVVAGLLLSLVLGPALAALTASPASAQARVSVESTLGSARVHLDGATEVRLSGTGFQSVQGGFGGIYVLFGWVDDPQGGSWSPSNGGQIARNYLYVPDLEQRDNHGYQRFVTFPGSSTASAANGGELAADGSWNAEMVIPGPRFTARDRAGDLTEIDCAEVTCGIITIGAHGVVSPANETFTPLAFVGAAEPAGSSEQESGGADAGEAAPGGAEAGEARPADNTADNAGQSSAADADTDTDADAGAGAGVAEAEAAGPATIGLERGTVQAGHILTFTGRGFAAGEQVAASLGAGEAGAGPMVAGSFGEVAGALRLPADLRAGTHVLRLEGAGSAQVAEVEVSVLANPATLTPAVQEPAAGWSWAYLAAVILAAVLLVLVVSSLVTALVRRRQARRRAAKPTAADPPLNTQEAQETEVLAPLSTSGAPR